MALTLSGNSGNTTLDSSNGITFSDSSNQQYAASPYGLKNRIINGDMRIDQRNAGASVTPATNQYLVDRFMVQVSQSSKFTAQQNAGSVTPPTGFTNYLGCTSSSAYTVGSSDYFSLQHRIEGYNIADLAWGTANAKTITISFWVRSSLTGTFGGAINNADNTRAYPFSYTISSANTWEQKTITIAGDTSGTWLTTNGIGLIIYWSLGTGSTYSGTAGSWSGTTYLSATGATNVVATNGATFYITGVQLEVGSTATPFERRMYGQELALCQRYCETSYDYGVAIGTGSWANGTLTTVCGPSSSYTIVLAQFKVEKRTAPTVTWYSAKNGTSGYGTNNGGAGSDFAWAGAVQPVGMYCAGVYAGTATSGTLGTASTHFVATAEL